MRSAGGLALLWALAVPGPLAAQAPRRVPSEPIPFESAPTVPEPAQSGDDGVPLWLIEPAGWRGVVLERYSRVDGLVAGLGAHLQPTNPDRTPEISLRVHRAFAPDRWYWEAAARQRLPFAGPWVAHAEVRAFHRSTTFDDWKLSQRENDFTTFLVGSDLLDWWRERGYRAGLDVESERGDFGVALAFFDAEQFSQRDREPFVLIGAGDFRSNPEVATGRLRSVTFTQSIDTRDVQSPFLPAAGWRVRIEAERAGGRLGGNVEFTRGFADVRRYVRIRGDAWWDTRLVWIESDAPESAPVPQRHAMLGGPGSLRGFRAGRFTGTDAVQLNSEIRLPLPLNDTVSLLFYSWHWVGFVDAGSVDDTWKVHANVGTGISGLNLFSYVGIFVAQQVTDLGGDDDGPHIVVRLRRDF